MAHITSRNFVHKNNKPSALSSVNKKVYYKTIKHPQSNLNEKPIENKRLVEEKIKATIEEMELSLEAKDYENVLLLGNNAINLFASLKEKDLKRSDILYLKGCIFLLLSKSHIQNNNHTVVLEYAPVLTDITHKISYMDFNIDVNNIIAQANIMAKDYRTAANLWQRNLKLAKNRTEKAFYYHEIGRCCYQMAELSEARVFGLCSLTEASTANNNLWCLNAALLIAQSETLMGCNQEALESFIEAEKYAYREKKQDVIDFIRNQKKMFLEAMVENTN